MNSIEDFLRVERENASPCKVTVTLLASGEFRARMSFAPGMDTAEGTGLTVDDAIERLENELNGGAA